MHYILCFLFFLFIPAIIRLGPSAGLSFRERLKQFRGETVHCEGWGGLAGGGGEETGQVRRLIIEKVREN